MRFSRFLAILVCAACGFAVQASVLRPILPDQVAPRRLSWSEADQLLWFSDEHQTPATVGFYNPLTGRVQSFPVTCDGCDDGTARAYIEDMFASYGEAWFAWTRVGMDGSPTNGGMNSYLSRVSENGAFTTYPIGIKDAFRRYEFGSIGNSHVILRPDGTVLFTMNAIGHIGVLDPDSGAVLDKPLSSAFSEPSGAALAPNGNTIVAMAGVGKLAEISLANVIKEYQVPDSGNLTAAPIDVAAGADGRLMFTDLRGRVGLFSNGSFRMAPLDASCTPDDIEAGGSGEFFIACGGPQTGSVGHVMINSALDATTLQISVPQSSFDTAFATYPVNLAWSGQQVFVSAFVNEGNALVDRLYEEDAIARCGLDLTFEEQLAFSTRPVLSLPIPDWAAFEMPRIPVANDIEFEIHVDASGGTPPRSIRILDPLPKGVEFDGMIVRGKPSADAREGDYAVRFVVTDSSVPPCARAKTLMIEVKDALLRKRAVRH